MPLPPKDLYPRPDLFVEYGQRHADFWNRNPIQALLQYSLVSMAGRQQVGLPSNAHPVTSMQPPLVDFDAMTLSVRARADNSIRIPREPQPPNMFLHNNRRSRTSRAKRRATVTDKDEDEDQCRGYDSTNSASNPFRAQSSSSMMSSPSNHASIFSGMSSSSALSSSRSHTPQFQFPFDALHGAERRDHVSDPAPDGRGWHADAMEPIGARLASNEERSHRIRRMSVGAEVTRSSEHASEPGSRATEISPAVNNEATPNGPQMRCLNIPSLDINQALKWTPLFTTSRHPHKHLGTPSTGLDQSLSWAPLLRFDDRSQDQVSSSLPSEWKPPETYEGEENLEEGLPTESEPFIAELIFGNKSIDLSPNELYFDAPNILIQALERHRAKHKSAREKRVPIRMHVDGGNYRLGLIMQQYLQGKLTFPLPAHVIVLAEEVDGSTNTILGIYRRLFEEARFYRFSRLKSILRGLIKEAERHPPGSLRIMERPTSANTSIPLMRSLSLSYVYLSSEANAAVGKGSSPTTYPQLSNFNSDDKIVLERPQISANTFGGQSLSFCLISSVDLDDEFWYIRVTYNDRNMDSLPTFMLSPEAFHYMNEGEPLRNSERCHGALAVKQDYDAIEARCAEDADFASKLQCRTLGVPNGICGLLCFDWVHILNPPHRYVRQLLLVGYLLRGNRFITSHPHEQQNWTLQGDTLRKWRWRLAAEPDSNLWEDAAEEEIRVAFRPSLEYHHIWRV